MDLLRVILRMLLECGWAKRKGLFVTLGVAATLLIGWFDYITTDEINLSFLYLIPVSITTLAVGRRSGVAMSLACAAIKIVTDVYSDQPYARSIYYAFNGLGLFAAFACFALLLDQLGRAYGRECALNRSDALTGLPNNWSFLEQADAAMQDRQSRGQPFFLLLLDIDDLKAFNVANGYHCGDLVLQAVARTLESSLPHAALARLEGDDFAAILPHAVPEDTLLSAQRLQGRLDAVARSKGWGLTFGVCLLTCWSLPALPEQLIATARAALREAKAERGPGAFAERTC